MSTRSPRLTRADRREQLLDAAAAILVEAGSDAVTMERLAERAGVSKALPYAHFQNADDVMIALYGRYVGALGARVSDAIDAAGEGIRAEHLVDVVVAAYFDAVADLGPVLAAVSTPESRPSQLADPAATVGPDFVADVLVAHFGVAADRARAAAPVLLAALVGAAGAWGRGRGTRPELEAVTRAVFLACIT